MINSYSDGFKRNIIGTVNRYGSIENIGALVSEFQVEGRVAVISDSNVAKLYLGRCERSLQASGFTAYAHVFSPGESNKNLITYEAIMEFLADIPLSRNETIIALGGGVTGDLAGFAAATYMRGVKYIQVPTTLLAAVDSSVGGKTAIDLRNVKNLAGVFYLPSAILLDVDIISNLSEEIFREGMAEVIKAAAVDSRSFFDTLMWIGGCEEAKRKNNLNKIIRQAIEIKRKFVNADPKDLGLRHILNFGHTIAHAVESLSGYKITHGIAVAKGMAAMADMSYSYGLCDKDARDMLIKMIVLYGFDTAISFSPVEIFEATKSDKKICGDDIDIVVLREIGECEINHMKLDDFHDMLLTIPDFASGKDEVVNTETGSNDNI